MKMKKISSNIKEEREANREQGISARRFFLGMEYLINNTPSIKNPIKVVGIIFAVILEVLLTWCFVNQAMIPSLIEGVVHDTQPIMILMIYVLFELFAIPGTIVGVMYYFEVHSILSSDKDMIIKNDDYILMEKKEEKVIKPIAKKEPKPIKVKVPMNPSSKEAHYQPPKGNVIPMSHARKMAYMKKVEEYGKEL